MFLKKSYISIFILLFISILFSYSLTLAQYTSIPFTGAYTTATSAYPSYTTSYPTTSYAYTTPTTTNAYSTYPTSTSYLSTSPYSTYPTSTSYLSANPYSTYPTSTSYLSANPYSTYPTSSNYLFASPYSTYPTSTSYLSTNPFSTYPLASFGTYNPLSSAGYNFGGYGMPAFGSFSSFASPFTLQDQLINTTNSLLDLLTSLTAPPLPALLPSLYSNPYLNATFGGLSSGLPFAQQPYTPFNPVGAINPFTQYNQYAPVASFNPFNPVDAFNPVSQQQNITGTWTGTWFSQDNGVVNSGEVSISFTQSGAQITSQSVVSFVSRDGTPKLQANVTGTLNGATVNISGNMPSGSSIYTLTIIADISGNYMSGSYSVLDGSGQTIESGTVSLSNGQ
ncbi:MAG: hypothetical protein ACMUIP_11305 [bacterium]